MTDTEPGPFRAQTIELFFDLVFVFTITKITHLIEHAHGAVDFLHALAVLMLVWWMYGGYIWLTNHAHTPRSMRLVLVAAMAGFLVMALAIPESAGEGRLLFGAAYLAIVLLHFLAFVWQGGPLAARAMLRIVPFNLGAAALVIGSSLLDGSWSWILLLSPALLYVVVSVANTGEGFALDVGHFVERHGLLLIIVLGEIVISTGSGFAALPHEPSDFAILLLAVALIGALWWSYFDRDDQRAEHRMAVADNRRRTRIALFGYNGAHLFMIAGLILVAGGLKAVISAQVHLNPAAGAHSAEAAHGNDAILLYGLGLYLAFDSAFRSLLGLRPLSPRLAGAALAVTLALLGPLHGLRMLGTALVVVIVILVVEGRMEQGGAH